ncbi:hypothetical protein J2T22_001571 [Pseudarthrobacter defluvii]|uniref:Uncharacterized protein n=1 Tax=Pseudarthrobacter defluvii TaxID=410837 RepID=A0ABT9UFG9_9MICC|nr:hypothetical protein [Pseudarthrobacter defluvii]
MISCKEGRPLFAQMETDIWMDRTADGGWITSKVMRSAAHGLKLITVLKKEYLWFRVPAARVQAPPLPLLEGR